MFKYPISLKGVSAKHGSALHHVSAHGNDALYSQPSAVGVHVADPVEVLATEEQFAVSLHLSELQLLSVNDFTSGQLWLLCRMKLVQIRTCKFQLYVYAGSSLDASMQSLPEEEPVVPEDILSFVEYANEINQHLRKSEVSIWLFKKKIF